MTKKIIFVFIISILIFLGGCIKKYEIVGEDEVYLYSEIKLTIVDLLVKADDEFAWISSNSDIASIDEQGNVYGVSIGTVTITANLNDKIIASKTITVLAGPDLQVTGDNIIAINETKSLTVTSPMAGDQFTFETLDNNILTIDSQGNYTGVNAGATSIIVRSAKHGYYTFYVNVIAKYEPESIEVTNLLDEYIIGERYQLTATVYPDFANQEVTWEVVGTGKASYNSETNEIEFLDIGEVTVICRSAVDSTVRKVVTLKARYGDDVDVINILFLGNSHTYYNDVPGLVEGIGKAAGKAINCEHISEGGATIILLLAKYQEEIIAKLESADYQYLIVQEQSSSNFLYPDAFLFAVEHLKYIVSEYDVEILLYQTWAYEENSSSLLNVHLTYEEMHQLVTEAYHEVSRATGVAINPVGEVFDAFKRQYPEHRLYTDGNHANTAGSYLSACVHYYSLFNESLIGNEYQIYIDDDLKTLIQEFVTHYLSNE